MAFGSLRLMAVAMCFALLVPAPIAAQGASGTVAPGARRTVRVLLNSAASGTNAWLLLADTRGYFRNEGLDVQFTSAQGAYAVANRMVSEPFDFGYGDINALTEEASVRPDSTPLGVYMLYNRSPAAIMVKRSSPIVTLKQLQGKKIFGQSTDAALNTFDAFATKAGITEANLTITSDSSAWETLLTALEDGRADAIFGDISAGMAAIEASGRDADSTIRFIRYRDVAPELYGNALIASRAMIMHEPALVKAFVRAANRGLLASINDPDAAISEARRRNPALRAEVERNRLLRSMYGDMGGAEGASQGLGDIDPKRFAITIKLMRAAERMQRSPEWDQVFSRDFLPAESERIKTLAEARKK